MFDFVFNTLHVLQWFSPLSFVDLCLQIRFQSFHLRFWSFRSPFWHKSLVGAGLAVVCSHWLLSFWLTASWPGSEGVSVAPPVWMWASLTVRSHRRQRERQSGRKSFIFNVSRRRAPARASWRVLDGESVEESWNQVNFMVMSYDAVRRQPIGM